MEKTKTFLDMAKKNQNGVKILYGLNQYFAHNVALWKVWLEKLYIKVMLTTDFNDIHENDLCICISHLFKKCPAKIYVAIQTENLVTMTVKDNCYNSIDRENLLNMLKNAFVTWDYSNANVQCLEKMGITDVLCLPIMASDNSDLWNPVINKITNIYDNFWNRKIDGIMANNTPRRTKLLNDLKLMGLSSIEVWRTSLPTIISSCKVFINVHAHHSISALEIHRLFDLRNMPIVIISEKSLDDEYEKELDKILFVSYDDLVPLCHKICNDENLWKKLLLEQKSMWEKFSNDRLHNYLMESIGNVKVHKSNKSSKLSKLSELSKLSITSNRHDSKFYD